MKKLLVLILTVVLLFAISACDNYTGDVKITRDEAIQIALEKAKVNKVDVYDLDVELDYEKKALVWDIDFEYQNLEHSYRINAQTGAIIFETVERD